MQSWSLKRLLMRRRATSAASVQPNIASTGVSSTTRKEPTAMHPVAFRFEILNPPLTTVTLVPIGDPTEKVADDDSEDAVSSTEGSQVEAPSSAETIRIPTIASPTSVVGSAAGNVTTKGVLSTVSTGDSDTFNTMDIHPQDQPLPENYKVFSLPANPAGFPIGLTWLDIDRCSNIRINASAELVTEGRVNVHLDTSADSVLYSAGCTWLTTYANDRDFQFGGFSTTEDHPFDKPQPQTSRKITFPKPFHGKPPEVIVWLNEFHMSNDANWRCKAYVTDIAVDSFVIHIDTWANTTLYSATASWIAHASNRPNIASGSFNTMDVRPWYIPMKKNKGGAEFHRTFESIPRVLAAVNWLDISNRTNLRLKLGISNVSAKGLNWRLDAWGDTVLYSAGASYIAILDL